MKKIIALVLLVSLALACLCSCGEKKRAYELLNGKTFCFEYARVDAEVRACASALAEKYPETRNVDYTLKAEEGALTFTGEGGTYTGTYTVSEVLEKSIVYEITVGEESGHASLTEQSRADGTAEYVFIITIRGYVVTFGPERTTQ
ncbi:MAG: hypothetical protein IJW21_01640 [Clostridia bacterium]|nr:hypothetical protein [Clostridia bacterium]